MNYITTNAGNDVLASLEMMDIALSHCEDNPNLWKWIIIALHSALQGAMVCHLSGSAQLGALSDKSIENFFRHYEGKIKGPKRKESLASSKILFERLKKGEYGYSFIDQQTVTVSQDQENDFDLLHTFRNDFIHFQPIHKEIEISGMPRIVRSQIKIIEDIFLAGRRFSILGKADLQPLLEKIRSAPILDKLHE